VWVCTFLWPYAFLESTGRYYLYAITKFLFSSLDTPSFPWGYFIMSAVFRTPTFSYIYFYGEAGKIAN
jgi:hypothetical protein